MGNINPGNFDNLLDVFSIARIFILLLFSRYSSLQFTKNPEKYIKYTVEEVEAMLKSFFDVSAWWLWWICLVYLYFFKIQRTIHDIINYTKKQTSLYLVAVDFSQKVQNLYRWKSTTEIDDSTHRRSRVT